MPQTIVFGPVVHKDKSYAYSLGYGASMMGHMRDHNPYTRPDQAQNHEDFMLGYDKGVADTNQALDEFQAKHGGSHDNCIS